MSHETKSASDRLCEIMVDVARLEADLAEARDAILRALESHAARVEENARLREALIEIRDEVVDCQWGVCAKIAEKALEGSDD